MLILIFRLALGNFGSNFIFRIPFYLTLQIIFTLRLAPIIAATIGVKCGYLEWEFDWGIVRRFLA